jgi:2-polyprenyl-6-methoxyphenol hydroxylase-like FAD-dependent oxidoreductase
VGEHVIERVVVVGGGVGGLASALALSRAGHPVTVLERDPLPPPHDVEEAFRAQRRGAPQVHQTHGFLARLVVELRRCFPDVLEELLAAGCTTMPLTARLGGARPGDEDLAVLVVRRTTFEWILRRAVLAQPGTEVRTGVGVAGLAGAPGPALPTVTGVRLDDGSVLEADAVVAASGRRGPLPTWLGALGAAIPETVHESGLMYLSRWYGLPDGFGLPPDPKLAGNLGFIKYLGIPGDGGTLSVTLAIRVQDAELRGLLSDPATFDEACQQLEGPSLFWRHGPVVPLTGVLPMGGLLNRIRRFVGPDGQPAVLGLHAVGDAHTCTNPLYGRGCSLSLVQAIALADAFAGHPDDPVARALNYEAACAREVEPWFDLSVQMDAMGADPAGKQIEAAEAPASRRASAEEGAQRRPEQTIRRGIGAVFAAGATDPVLGRGLLRMMNLLATPADLLADAEFLTRAMEVMADPDRYPTPPVPGPSRDELLQSLRSLAA